jgi:hypothetical protein
VAIERPTDLFDRVEEWADLTELVNPARPGMRIGILSGRRRHGKSFVLRRLAIGVDGLYHQARELEKTQALAMFADDVAASLGLDPGTLAFPTWEAAFRLALGLPGRSSARSPQRRPTTLVIDELPYLLAHSPEIPSVLQLLYDEAQSLAELPATTVILCGSSLSVMVELLSGNKPLRGRAQLDLTMRSFDFRQARDYWQVADPHVAFHLDAVLGGTPGYRPLVSTSLPGSVDEMGAWLAQELLNPARALFNERAVLLREDPRILDKAAYNSILQAVAAGNHTTKGIGAAVGRDHNTLRHPLGVLESAGFLLRVEDMLVNKRPTYHLADPIIRFAEVVIEPHRSLLEERDPTTAWKAAAPAYSSQILGPHFEHLARVWTARYSAARLGVPVGEVGPAVVNDPDGRARHEIDVLALERGRRIHDHRAPVLVLGEAKSTNKARTVADLARLDRIRDTLVTRQLDAADARLVLFARNGFDQRLHDAAATRSDVHLITLDDLYT